MQRALLSSCCFVLALLLMPCASGTTRATRLFPRPEPITLVFQDAPLRGVLQALAEFRHLNLMLGDDVQGSASLRLIQVPWEQALQAIARQYDLSVEQQGGILFIQSAARGEQRRQQQAAPPALKPLRVMLQQADAQEVGKSLQQSGGLLSERGSVSADARTNALLIRDEAGRLKAIGEWLDDVDKAVAQVQLRAHIVTIDSESLRELGVRWSSRADADKVEAETGRRHFRLNQFSMGIPVQGKSLLGDFQIARIGGSVLELELAALEQEDKVNIIASPYLLTENQQTASIKQGTEIPYEVSSGASGATSIEFKEAVLGMEVTPRVMGRDRITLALKISQNMPGRALKQQDGEVLAIDKQEISTRVTVVNGETVILGGIFQQHLSQGQSRVPGLGRIPVLGPLFRDSEHKQRRRELAIFITPTLIKRDDTARSIHQTR